jgi:cold shock CspA family protein
VVHFCDIFPKTTPRPIFVHFAQINQYPRDFFVQISQIVKILKKMLAFCCQVCYSIIAKGQKPKGKKMVSVKPKKHKPQKEGRKEK